jgi:hypothetical protein
VFSPYVSASLLPQAAFLLLLIVLAALLYAALLRLFGLPELNSVLAVIGRMRSRFRGA